MIMSNVNYDTVEWSPEALELKKKIDARLTDPLLEELAEQVGMAWDDYFSFVGNYRDRSIIKDCAWYLTDALNVYKDDTAALAAQLSKARPLEQYTGDTIGKLQLRGDYSGDGSVPEWLSGRKHGLGGSDIGNALDVTTGKYAKSSDEVLDEKATLELDFDDTLQNIATKTNNFSGALGRGNAWESVIAHMFQREHADEYKVLEAKATYYNPEHTWQTVNVDGLLCSDGVNPDGILEIKTSSKPWDGEVPIGYRAQVLNYMNATGFDYAYVAVLVNDLCYEEYIVYSDETISGKPYQSGSLTNIDFYDAVDILDELWDDVLAERRKRYGNGWERVLADAPANFYREARKREASGDIEPGIVTYPAHVLTELENKEHRRREAPAARRRSRRRRTIPSDLVERYG